MHASFIMYFRGYVEVEIRGGECEAFMNRALQHGCHIWRIHRTSPTNIRLYTDLHSFFRFKALLRQTHCTMHVQARYGLPFLLNRLESRLFLALGVMVFVVGIYALSQVVWQVEVNGNERISYDQIMEAAERNGIHTYQWKFKLQQAERLSRALTQELPGAAWVSVKIIGTKVQIQVVEQTKPEPRELNNPRHLIASTDAVITEIFVERGRPMVKVNAKVKKGDVLVSGIIGNEANQVVVVAEASVKGLVWHEYDIQIPLTHDHKVYTGESKIRQHLVLGNRAIQMTGYGKTDFTATETNSRRRALQWRDFVLPLGWIREEIREVRIDQEILTAEDAAKIGLTQARAHIMLLFGKEMHIHDEIILHEKVEGGKVYMKVLFEVEQEISTELPIIQGE